MRGNTEHEDLRARNELAALSEGDVLCDRHRRECYQVTAIDDDGIGLHQDGIDFYTPRPLFVTWYGQRLFAIDGNSSIETPVWCEKWRDGETPIAGDPERPPLTIAGRPDQ